MNTSYYYSTQTVRARRPSRAAKRPDSTLTVLLVIGALMIISAPLVAAGGLYTYFLLSDAILPNVYIGDIPVGGLTWKQAAAEVDRRWNTDKKLIVGYQDQVWLAAPADFGLGVNPDATIERAYGRGRGADGLTDVLEFIYGNPLTVPPVVAFYPEMARSQLALWSGYVDHPPQDARLALQDGQWLAIPGQNGLTLDVEATLDKMVANPDEIMTGGRLSLEMQPVAPRIGDVSQELARIQGLADKPLVVSLYDPIRDEHTRWEIAAQTLAAWVQVDGTAESPEFLLDARQLDDYLAGRQAELGGEKNIEPLSEAEAAALSQRWQNGEPVTALIRYSPTEYLIQPGDTIVSIAFKTDMLAWKILEANPGLNANTLYAGQKITIPSKSELLPLPVVVDKRIVISISRQRLWTFENGVQRDEYVISTGVADSPTQPGVFQVQTHVSNAYASVWDLYMPHFLGIYEAWPDFMNGIHGLPTLSNGQRLWENVLGRPASYGCIILPLAAAEDLYHWAEEGVVVAIER